MFSSSQRHLLLLYLGLVEPNMILPLKFCANLEQPAPGVCIGLEISHSFITEKNQRKFTRNMWTQNPKTFRALFDQNKKVISVYLRSKPYKYLSRMRTFLRNESFWRILELIIIWIHMIFSLRNAIYKNITIKHFGYLHMQGTRLVLDFLYIVCRAT